MELMAPGRIVLEGALRTSAPGMFAPRPGSHAIPGPRPQEPAVAGWDPDPSRYTESMRVLGIDLGSKRIGLAISDELGAFAFPAGILECRGRRRDIAALRTLIEDRGIVRAVVGLPIHMDGRRGPEAEKALAFARALHSSSGIPVDTLDERWTSQEAERLMQGTGKRQRRAQRQLGTVDELAASILLRTYLARLERGISGSDVSDWRSLDEAEIETP